MHGCYGVYGYFDSLNRKEWKKLRESRNFSLLSMRFLAISQLPQVKKVSEMLIEKIAEILTVAKQPCLRDHIICKCSFRSYTFKPYLNLLLENGLLDAYPVLNSKHLSGRPTKRRMTYQTSQKGLEFLKRYNELLTLMEIPLKYAPKLNFCGSRH